MLAASRRVRIGAESNCRLGGILGLSFDTDFLRAREHGWHVYRCDQRPWNRPHHALVDTKRLEFHPAFHRAPQGEMLNCIDLLMPAASLAYSSSRAGYQCHTAGLRISVVRCVTEDVV
jgi:hypothetical protein